MNKYRYKYVPWTDEFGHSSSNKSVCPNCGKKTFVRVVDTETGELLPEYVGKCDREDKCGYNYSYAQYFKEHPDTRYYQSPSPFFPKKSPRVDIMMKEKTVDTINQEIMSKTLNNPCFLKRFLQTQFDADEVEKCFARYNIGADNNKWTLFWQVDVDGKVRTAKKMLYDENTGHRRKIENSVSFIHSALKRQGKLPIDWTAAQVLFGSHLLKECPTHPVCIVESEKTAVICSILIPNFIWLATGGKQNMKQIMFEPLRSRNVVFFPDLGAYDEWEEKAKKLSARCSFKYSISQLLERVATPEERDAGLDIADFLLKNHGNKE